MLEGYDWNYGVKMISLKYLTAARADIVGHPGERHSPGTFSFTQVLQAVSGRCDDVAIFEDGYNTPDGTAFRDYIHGQDLCDAYKLALNALKQNSESQCYNPGVTTLVTCNSTGINF